MWIPLIREHQGNSLVEYALLAALICVVFVAFSKTAATAVARLTQTTTGIQQAAGSPDVNATPNSASTTAAREATATRHEPVLKEALVTVFTGALVVYALFIWLRDLRK
jgi:Flp pilus assembly pilin Flp